MATARIEASRITKDQTPSLPSKIKLPEPPFPHLLQSNTPPTDLEATDILKAISTAEAQYLHLQGAIEEYDLDMIVEQLDLAHQFVHAHKSILSAIRRIPSEILHEIFCQIGHPWQDDSRWETIPWTLSQVCQRWRVAALSTTSLWSQLPAIRLSKKKPRSYVAQINAFLVRSRDAPISFSLWAVYRGWESHPVIDALTRHSDRWQAVTITSLNITIFTLKGVKGRLSSLRTLSLHISFQLEPVVFDVFEGAPQLREVHLGGKFPGEIRLPFSQLTLYKEGVRGRGMVDHTISLATSLTSLEITRFFENIDIPVATLPFLVTLKVQFDIYHHAFLSRLTLPVIQEIWIAAYVTNIITDIIDIISRSHSPCILNKLVLRVSRLNELNSGELTRLLRLTPKLVALDLSLPPLEDLANLIIGQHSQPLVPLLQTLTIKSDAIRRPETNQLLNTIAVSRCSIQDSLTSAISHLPGDRQALKELRIVFNSPTICQYELRFLEGWVPSSESEQLMMWKEQLLKELPELQGRPAPPNRDIGLIWRDRVFNIFSDIEKFHMKNVNDIYVSEIHMMLRHFRYHPVTSIVSQFGGRAAEILEKWTPLFESHLKERRWVLKGDVSLVYLSSDDALRLSLTSSDIVYGLKDNLLYSEVSWPTNMFL